MTVPTLLLSEISAGIEESLANESADATLQPSVYARLLDGTAMFLKPFGNGE